MANADVDNTVKKVENVDHAKDGGAVKAYQELLSDFEKYKQTHTAEEAKTYWKGVTDQLTKDGVLPDLALAWGKENLAEADISGDGKLNKAELAQFKRYDQNVPENFIDTTFANALSDGALTKEITGKEDGQYKLDNIEDGLEDQTKENAKNAEQLASRDNMKPLFQGNPPLMQVIDGADAEGHKLDGKVARDDMEEFVDEYNRLTNNGKLKAPEGSPYTAENAKYVQDILDGKNPEISKDGFDVKKLAEKGGFDKVDIHKDGSPEEDYKALVTKFNEKSKNDHPVEAVATPTASPTDATPESTETTKPEPQGLSQKDQKAVLDIIAKDPKTYEAITDGNGNIDKKKLDELLASGDPSSLTGEMKAKYDALKSVSTNFDKLGGKDGKLNLDAFTKQAFTLGENDVTNYKFEDRLRAANNGTLTEARQQEIFDYIKAHPEEFTGVVDKDGKISKAALESQFAAAEMGAFVSAEQLKISGELLGAYNTLSTDGGKSVEVANLGEAPEQLPETGAEESAGGDANELTKDYIVQKGQGFDVIADDSIRQQLGREPASLPETRALSDLIAAANNNDRQYSGGQIHEGNKLVVPDLKAMEEHAKAQGIPFIDYVNQVTAALREEDAAQPIAA